MTDGVTRLPATIGASSWIVLSSDWTVAATELEDELVVVAGAEPVTTVEASAGVDVAPLDVVLLVVEFEAVVLEFDVVLLDPLSVGEFDSQSTVTFAPPIFADLESATTWVCEVDPEVVAVDVGSKSVYSGK